MMKVASHENVAYSRFPASFVYVEIIFSHFINLNNTWFITAIKGTKLICIITFSFLYEIVQMKTALRQASRLSQQEKRKLFLRNEIPLDKTSTKRNNRNEIQL